MNNEKINWKEVVSKSGGRTIFLPEGFTNAAKEIEEKRASYNKDAVAMAKKEIAMKVATQQFFFELRKHFEKNGVADIWIKDLGFNTAALQDGEFVIDILEPASGPRSM